MNIDSFKKRLEGIYWLNSLLPLMIIHIVNSVFFTNRWFNDYIEPFYQVIMTGYAIIVAVCNIITGKLKDGNRILVYSMLAFCIINLMSFFLTFDGSLFAFIMIYLIIVHYLSMGIPRTDLPKLQRRKEIEITIYVFICIATIWNILLLLIESFTNGLGVYIYGGRRLLGISSAADQNVLGFIAAAAAYFSVYLFVKNKTLFYRFLSVIVFFVNIFTLILTNSRDSEVFLLVSFFILALIFAYKKFSTKVFILISVCLVIFATLGCLFVVFSRDYSSISSSETLFESLNRLSTGRVRLWVNGIKAGLNSPLYGNSYSYLLDVYKPNQMAHNMVIDIFSRYGLFSIISLLSFLVIMMVYSLKVIYKEGNKKNHCYSNDFIFFVFCFSMIIGMLFQHLIDSTIFFTGYSTSNLFFVILSGYITYYISFLPSKFNPDIEMME